MKHLITFLLIFSSSIFVKHSFSQSITAKAENKPWNSSWIAAPNDPGNEYGVYYFRKSIDLAARPTSFVIHISADNRYKLYINGTLVSLGPARGDTYYWNYETVDLAPYLVSGKNIIAALNCTG
jgi:alpha-L-rhamnosidase